MSIYIIIYLFRLIMIINLMI